ncbi:MAG: hypothetical protein HEQ20_22220 [Aphanizomenon flos-aquae KM1D3_PB]|jgi:hypothetical protein|uniref:hypothetical protein n=1 Tax=Aphanizomenon flos-aquae TaxID=1176 RepID=UPI0005442B83|nr:hypothetical protein [Aphanizomenon flos-aquae]KHG39432.1 hypothetical protein OA07_23650 [Aphanizomenon flos-aquae 2012/KM1/D3]QSV72968.1 MAG: hypothetical protein HEQ20_22220 [Aphanizomenon flos-aquae KM1D3_PB]
MKTLRLFKIASVAFTMGLLLNQSSFADTPKTVIGRNQVQDPLVLNGTSRGGVKGNCGNINTAPNQIIEVTEPLPYLRLTVESERQPTLLISGPGGRFCVFADSYSGGKAELSGYWQPGKYLLYVGYIGDLSQDKFNYTLAISQQRQVLK